MINSQTTSSSRDSFYRDSFYVVAHEPGAEHAALPTWANHQPNPTQLAASHSSNVERVEVPGVPGAFQLLNVLTPEECERLIQSTEELGYLKDAAVSLPREIRHNHNVTWVVDESIDKIIWERCQHLVTDEQGIFGGKQALGINARFRFYRYQPGDYFQIHTDGSWPGSRVIDGDLIGQAYEDRWSQMTFLILLSEDFDGGETTFLVNKNDPSRPARRGDDVEAVKIRTPAGGVLCFPHGMHPLHCLHGSEPITKGTKYIIRTDILFEI
ncbi:prolyl hydroxylase family protein [Parendozoicomonas haliclonae]|uniref:Fe2OG dioxygenase domain-containing protein n=1 Tax=Parendozoicomonas haliclonae TaxID=1960125 RepID=A0A1X7AJE7_9GAMM|nr:2OG-Fe(II) oxygenase [Parendozoicomonas haliclonae]SMA45406.1 hypothetical protein EHSB41UT_01915 [Parendozoicomonas haliclonae]